VVFVDNRLRGLHNSRASLPTASRLSDILPLKYLVRVELPLKGGALVPLFALIIVAALWGSHPIVGKAVEHQMTALQLSVWRFTFSALCYLPLVGRLKRIFRLPRKTFWQLALAGLCWAVLYPLFYYQSLLQLSPVDSLLLVNTSPFFAALFAWLFFREQLGWRAWLGIIVSFSGVVLLLSASTSGAHLTVVGVGLALVAAVAFGGYTVTSRSLFQTLPLFDVLVATSLWGVVDLWIICLFTGRVGGVVHALTRLSASGWEEFLYIVVIVSTVAYMLYGYGLARMPAGIASAVTFYPQALFAAVVEWVWFGNVPTWLTAVSGVLILGGTALMRKRKVAVAVKGHGPGSGAPSPGDETTVSG